MRETAPSHLVDNLLLFGRVLRRAGSRCITGRMLDAAEALEVDRRRQRRRCARDAAHAARASSRRPRARSTRRSTCSAARAPRGAERSRRCSRSANGRAWRRVRPRHAGDARIRRAGRPHAVVAARWRSARTAPRASRARRTSPTSPTRSWRARRRCWRACRGGSASARTRRWAAGARQRPSICAAWLGAT